MIRTGIVGLGRWGQRMVSAVTDNSPSDLICYVSAHTRSPEKVTDFCKQRDIVLTPNYETLLQDSSIDAVVLATPHSQHVKQIKQAATAGKHVFVEKPISLELDGVKQAIQACNQAGVILAAGFNRRFLPAYNDICSQLNAGRIGQALHIEGSFSGPFGYSYSSNMWRGTRSENPAGGMGAMGIHVLDAMIHLMGPVKSVQASSIRQVLEAEVDDTTSVLLKFESGATGYLSTLMATAQQFRLQLNGSKGWLAMRDHETLDYKNLEGELTTAQYDAVDIERLEQEAFAKTLLKKIEYPVENWEILNGVAAMQAIAASAEKDGSRIAVAS